LPHIVVDIHLDLLCHIVLLLPLQFRRRQAKISSLFSGQIFLLVLIQQKKQMKVVSELFRRTSGSKGWRCLGLLGLYRTFGQDGDPATIQDRRLQSWLAFIGGLARVPIHDKFGFINRQGELVIPPRFDSAGPYSEGLACVKFDGAFGYINESGVLTIAARFEYAEDFREGLARVKIGNMYGFINREGDIVIPLSFIAAEDFEGGLCYVETLKDVGYINSSGEFVWKRRYAGR
jgi:hypothetical protein